MRQSWVLGQGTLEDGTDDDEGLVMVKVMWVREEEGERSDVT